MATADRTAPTVAQCRSLELPAVIAAEVSVVRFSEALARAGLVSRRDAARGVLVIEPAPALCLSCGGKGLDEDAVCDFCDGVGREGAAPRRALSCMPYAPAAIIPVGAAALPSE